MFQSRRVKYIKAMEGEGISTHVKANVLKSFSTDVTQTVLHTVLFEGNKPKKAFCECPVGACGLCCHAVLVLVLLHLKYFTEISLDLNRAKHDACPLHFLFHFTANNVHFRHTVIRYL